MHSSYIQTLIAEHNSANTGPYDLSRVLGARCFRRGYDVRSPLATGARRAAAATGAVLQAGGSAPGLDGIPYEVLHHRAGFVACLIGQARHLARQAPHLLPGALMTIH